MLRWLLLTVHLAASVATVILGVRAYKAYKAMTAYEDDLRTMRSTLEYAKLGAPGNYHMPTVQEQTSVTEQMVEESNTMKAHGWSAVGTFAVSSIALGAFVKMRRATR